METLNFIAGFFSIISSFATVIALFFAWRMWKTWKIQQTYSLHREKLIENEINIIALYHYQGNVMKQVIEMTRIELFREMSESEQASYTRILESINIKVIGFEDKYGFCFFTLERYGIHYTDNLKFDILRFREDTQNWIQRITSSENLEDLNMITTAYFNESAIEREILLRRLEEFRHLTLK
ncbi:hypothetical protein JZM36_15705 [Acinetobacter pittii]|uniref:hypothetical protein n=1 Tax=Acinetobacter pittii TaxID=48296 RepID=UPI001980E84F|nr:hypothetical protein [Acinetobacter pittii]MBN6518307.1 hypothetical protein [Acinetobacter pittii]